VPSGQSTQGVPAAFLSLIHDFEALLTMKTSPHKFLAASLLAVSALAALPAQAQVTTTVQGVLAPGVYGRIDIGNAPPPPVIYAQPVIIQRAPVYVEQQPLYLRVPPGHEKNWGKHCRKYNACGQPVYFVREGGRQEDHDRGRDDDNHGKKDKFKDKQHGNGKGNGKHDD
jgi:hypothetical protein